jgi:hypothetical protein
LSGTSSASDQRRVITVSILSEWDNPPGSHITDPKIWRAAICALSAWNNATDQYGNHTAYFLKLSPSTQNAQSADVNVRKVASSDPASFSDALPSPSPYATNSWEVGLDPRNVNFDDATLCGRLKHEIGHTFGLGNSLADPKNPACASVMVTSVPFTGDRSPLADQITSEDVALSNLNIVNRSSCKRTIFSSNNDDVCTNSTSSSSYDVSYYDPARNYCTATHQVTNTYDCTGALASSSDQIISLSCQTTCWATGSQDWQGSTYTNSIGYDCNDTYHTDSYQCSDGGFPNNTSYVGTTCVPPSGGGGGDPGGGGCGTDGTVCEINDGTGGPSPIILDVDGTGYSLTNAADGVDFDLNSDGKKEHLSWTSAGSLNAFLVFDRNRDGFIGNGQELFGNYTLLDTATRAPNGWVALAEFDQPKHGGNRDGVIDHHDAIYSVLRLWQDTNHDGISQPEELHTLQALGVDIIHLDYQKEGRRDRYGNLFRYRALIEGHHPLTGKPYRRFAFDVFLVPVDPSLGELLNLRLPLPF